MSTSTLYIKWFLYKNPIFEALQKEGNVVVGW